MVKNSPNRLLVSLGFISAVSITLLIGRIAVSDSSRFIFLFWNLLLAAVPPLLAWWLVTRIQNFGWLAWQQIAITLLWLSFLPNSFYLISDFVHLRPSYEADLLFDIVMLTSFLFNGLIFGFISVYLVHIELLKRISFKRAYGFIAVVFFVCSFAVYLGRYTRWNSWDILLRPAGLVFDVSDRFVNPSAHEQTYLTTLTFFFLLFGVYSVIWEAARLIRNH
jgi:uncharacterized membrane protein